MRVKFAEVLEIRNGKNQRQVENPQGKYPIYGSGGVMGYADDFICDAETVVIGRKGSINNPIFVNEPFWNVDTAFGLVANREILLPKYLYYFCVNYDFEKLNTTVTIPSLTKANLLQINIDVPELNQQKAVVEKLDKIEHLISIRRQQLAKLDELVKARFVEMFGDPDSIKEKEPLRNYLKEITYGFTNPMPDTESGPWKITAKDVVDGKINLSTARKTSMEAFNYLTAKSKPIIGDVLLTKDGSLGRTAIVDVPDICVNQSVAVLRCNERLMPKFLVLLLQIPAYQKEMLANAGGGTIKHIYITKIDKMPVYVPKTDEQKCYLKSVEQVEKAKATVQASIAKLETLKQSLMQEYFG